MVAKQVYGIKVIVKIEEELRDLAPQFLENRRKEIPELWNALKQNDFKNLQRVGHRLKGSAGGYGFFHIYELAENMEAFAKENNFQGLVKIITELDAYVSQVEIIFE